MATSKGLFTPSIDTGTLQRDWPEMCEAIVNTTPDGILAIDKSGNIRRWNLAASAMFGYDAAEFASLRVDDLMPEPFCNAHQGHLDRSIRTGERRIIGKGRELLAQRKDGSTFPIELTVTEFHVTGELLFAGVIRDITDRKRLEEERRALLLEIQRREAMVALGALIGSVAHEIRNPLQIMSGWISSLALRAGEDRHMLRYVAAIRAEMERISQLMRDLLDFARPRDQEMSIEVLTEADLREVIQLCLNLVNEKAARISIEFGPDVPPIRMDRRRLIAMFRNLLENSLYHVPNGGEVVIRASRQENGSGCWTACTVLDNGPGFRDEDLSRIFDPFFTRRREGTGLGLSIVHRIVQDHSGAIQVGNRPEGGAIVTVLFPAAAMALGNSEQ